MLSCPKGKYEKEKVETALLFFRAAFRANDGRGADTRKEQEAVKSRDATLFPRRLYAF